jgi:ABC-2 type transport system permease protein
LLKGFFNIFLKELKELARDPKILLGMIVVPLVIFPLLGGIIGFSVQSAAEKAQMTPLLVVNNDGGYWSNIFIGNLSLYTRAFVVNNTSPEDVVSQGLLSTHNTTQFVEIPANFTNEVAAHFAVSSNITATVNFYSVYAGASPFESIGSTVIDSSVYAFNRVLAPDVVSLYKSTIIKNTIQLGVDPALLAGLLISQSIALPITVMILLTYSMQVAATSVAMEKEEKTLETLLSLPVDRFAILMGKLSGSILIAALGALAYMVGFTFYTSSIIPTAVPIDLAQLGLVPSPLGYVLLGISLFVALLSALALAVIVSAFAEDVRGATSIVGYVYPLIFIPSFVLLYIDIGSLPLPFQIILYAIPYSQPILASKSVIMGDFLTPILGIVYVTAFTVVVMYAASRLFATERILTARLKFRGLGRRRTSPPEELQ